jgi:hypothetical protein
MQAAIQIFFQGLVPSKALKYREIEEIHYIYYFLTLAGFLAAEGGRPLLWLSLLQKSNIVASLSHYFQGTVVTVLPGRLQAMVLVTGDAGGDYLPVFYWLWCGGVRVLTERCTVLSEKRRVVW